MTQKFLLETSFVIDFLQNKKKAYEVMSAIGDRGILGTSTICLGELYEGAFYAKKKDQALLVLKDFKKGLLDEIWNVDEEIAYEFGRLRGNLRKRGELIDDLDILIAATCLVNDLILVTFNLIHFKRVPHLKIYS